MPWSECYARGKPAVVGGIVGTSPASREPRDGNQGEVTIKTPGAYGAVASYQTMTPHFDPSVSYALAW